MVGRAQESIASLGAICCDLAPARNRRRGYADCGLGFSIGIGIFKGSLSPSAPRYQCASFNVCFGRASGAANHSKIKYACRKVFLGVFPSFRSSRASISAFSKFSLGCRLWKLRRSKAAGVESFILLAQTNARFNQIPSWAGEICN